MNAIYAKHFEFGNTPARATISVTSLPGGNTIQFTGVAIADLVAAARVQAEEHAAERDRQSLRDGRRHVLLLGQGTVHARARGRHLQGIWVGTVEAQVRQTMRNLLDGLEEAGLSLANVVATNVYLDDMNDFARMNRIYAQYFPDRAAHPHDRGTGGTVGSHTARRGHVCRPRADVADSREAGALKT